MDAIAIDGEALTPDHFIVSDGVLEIPVVPQSFELSMTTIIDPKIIRRWKGCICQTVTSARNVRLRDFARLPIILIGPMS